MSKPKNTTSAPAKITRPQINNPVLRPRLFAKLDTLRNAAMLWITGPPGSGKTTLAGSYLAERGLAHLWYQLDANDADPATFFHYLDLAVRASAPRIRRALPALTPEYLPGLAAFTRRCAEILGDCVKPPALLVFDNYEQLPDDAPLHEVLRELAGALPKTANLLVLSRSAPPAVFARQRLHGDLVVLDGAELNLNREEAQAFSAARENRRGVAADPECIERLLAETRGWIAGFTLLLAENTLPPPDIPAPNGTARQLLFDYFATELYGRFTPNLRQALLRTALLPAMTLAHAEQMSGDKLIAATLTELHRQNCFVVRREQAEPVYEYHALFRSFLLSRAKAEIPPGEWRKLQRQAAALLADGAQADAAACLYRAAEDWPGLAALALREAPAMIAAGRHRILQAWLDALPEVCFEQPPWLGYWRGTARLPFDPAQARTHFERAYERFRADGDATGLYSAWAAIMETFFFEWRDLRPADRWIAEFETLRARHPEFPCRGIELRTYWAMGTLLHRRPQHPFLPAWAERGLALLDESDRDLSVLLGGYLVVWFLWRGESLEAWKVIETLAPWTHTPDLSPLVGILWRCAVAFYHSVHGASQACLEAVEDGLALARTTGLHCWDFLLAAQSARCCLIAGDPANAERWLALMAGTMRGRSHFNGAFYRHLRSAAAGQRGDRQEAAEYARSALAMALESGVPFLEAHCRIDLARALSARDGGEDWTEHLAAARALGQAMGSRVLEYLCLEIEAEAAFRQGREETGRALLAEALALSRAMDGATWLMAGPQASARLYDRAVAAGIETGHVRQQIRRRRIVPPDPFAAAECWPWPVRLYTLGRFDILCDDRPLSFSGKAQHKPLELLKCLCAFGGRAVHQERLSDALWPDAHGGDAEQALRTTLHRLRKLLQCERAVRLDDRHLSLDPNYIWVDCLDFDRAAHRPEQIGRDALQRALNRYRGHFLEGESAPCALTFRERLRAQFLKMSERLGAVLERDGDWPAAIDCYRRAVEIEPAAESFHRRLMACLAELGQRAEALAAYLRCRQALLAHLGVSPTKETQELYRKLAED